jgi:hypothetical protein
MPATPPEIALAMHMMSGSASKCSRAKIVPVVDDHRLGGDLLMGLRTSGVALPISRVD